MMCDISTWLTKLLKQSGFKVQSTNLKNSSSWKLVDGAIQHVSGYFFKIIGVRWTTSNQVCEQPLIEQSEIGTMGFILRQNQQEQKQEILIQGKIEPGNVGGIQIAPTCQATESNIKCVHGGKLPPYAEYFSTPQGKKICDSLRSEQGSRFFKKRNRNVTIVCDEVIPVLSSHRWERVETVLDLLKKNYRVNTDARSVLVSTPWHLLVGREPFSRFQDDFSLQLQKSYQSFSSSVRLDSIKLYLQSMQEQNLQIKKLEDLKNWVLNEEGISSQNKKLFRVRQICSYIRGREISHWDQPIIDSFHAGKIILLCAQSQNILHFLWKATKEPGLFQGELTPTIVVEPGSQDKKTTILSYSAQKIIAECWQSEEGSRFFRDINQFQIVDAGKVFDVGENYFWITLGDIQKLLQEKECFFTNEARSILSLLLGWL